jgi:glycosyltransferase involved in cell wall biosynthesis
LKDDSTRLKPEHFDGNLNLLFFGQVSRHKGVDILLEAFEKIAAEYPTAVLHLAGGYSDSEFEAACDEFATAHQLRSRIKSWGYVEDIEQLLKLAYVHVHPSPPSRFMDTFPLAALESMRYGVPTVCFKSGGLPEMIVDGSTGVVCESESAECFAAGLRKILSDPDLRDEYSKRASERYQQFYSERPVKRAWLGLFPENTSACRAG